MHRFANTLEKSKTNVPMKEIAQYIKVPLYTDITTLNPLFHYFK